MLRALRGIARLVFILFVLAVLGIGGFVGVTLAHFGRELPDYQQLAKYQPATGFKVYAGDGSFDGFADPRTQAEEDALGLAHVPGSALDSHGSVKGTYTVQVSSAVAPDPATALHMATASAGERSSSGSPNVRAQATCRIASCSRSGVHARRIPPHSTQPQSSVR